MVATTRPETMLGDTALAIHPDDPRTAALRGKTAILPIMNREIPIVEDPILVDREFGTGVVKVTPAHDANDFASARRLNLPAVVVIGGNGKMTAEAGEYAGLDRFEARKRVIARLEEEGRLVKTEPHVYNLGYCQRCDTIIEPYLSAQWFVKIQPLADPAIAAVEKGDVRFVPESWTKTYFAWMRDIHDWCISRQLWWGHRIPAFTCPNGHVTVSDEDPAACGECGSKELTQDPDVLDTWFSSQLWPFSVFGWPDETEDLEEFLSDGRPRHGLRHPLLLGGPDDHGGASVHGEGAVPHRPSARPRARGRRKDVEDQGQRHRPDRGDPGVRRRRRAVHAGFGGVLGAHRLGGAGAHGRLPQLRDEGLECGAPVPPLPAGGRPPGEDLAGRTLSLADRWILSRFEATAADANRHLEAFRFDQASDAIYSYVWHELCDGYLEMAKPALAGADTDDRGDRRAASCDAASRARSRCCIRSCRF